MTSIRTGGWAAVVGAVLAIAGNAALLVVTPAVSPGIVEYPLTTGPYVVAQLVFALTQALMALGVLALVRLRIAGTGRAARVFGVLAVVGMVITVAGELVLIPVATEPADSDVVSATSTVFGVGLLLANVGLIGLGVLALRRDRRASTLGVLSIVLGLFQILVVTPVSLAAGFASMASFVVIVVADLLVVALGVAVLGRAEAPGSELVPAPAHNPGATSRSSNG